MQESTSITKIEKWGAAGLTLTFVLLANVSFAQKTTVKDDYAASIAKFRQEKEADLRKPDGWLSLIGLQWLSGTNIHIYMGKDGKLHDHPYGWTDGQPKGLKFQIYLQMNGSSIAVLSCFPSNSFELNGKQLILPSIIPQMNSSSRVEIKPQSATSSPDILTYKTYTMFVIQRGDKFALRVKNSEAAARKNFKGMVWYGIDRKYFVEAKYIPYAEPKTLQVPTMVNIPAAMQNPGRVEFTLDGKPYSLDAVIEENPPKELFFIFKDLTATHGTYGAGRFLYTPLPSNGISKEGTVTLDFNKAENPPCAVTAYATCPIPPKQNRLEVAIPAGEKYSGDH